MDINTPLGWNREMEIQLNQTLKVLFLINQKQSLQIEVIETTVFKADLGDTDYGVEIRAI